MTQNHAVVPFVQIVNNQVITTTVDVSRKFGKHHKDVLRAIRNLEISDDFRQRNFAPVNIIEKNAIGGKIGHGCYNLTRDGFTILVMGFTGKRAMQFKIAYIEAFNKMETQLMQKRFPELPAPGLTPDQQRKVQQIVAEKVYSTRNKAMYPTLFRQTYGAIKDKFLVGKYSQVPASQFDDLIAYVQKVNIGTSSTDPRLMSLFVEITRQAVNVSDKAHGIALVGFRSGHESTIESTKSMAAAAASLKNNIFNLQKMLMPPKTKVISFDENTMIHAMDIVNMATDISHAIQKITVSLVSIQPDLGRLLQNVCILMPKEFEEVKRRCRLEEKEA